MRVGDRPAPEAPPRAEATSHGREAGGPEGPDAVETERFAAALGKVARGARSERSRRDRGRQGEDDGAALAWLMSAPAAPPAEPQEAPGEGGSIDGAEASTIAEDAEAAGPDLSTLAALPSPLDGRGAPSHAGAGLSRQAAPGGAEAAGQGSAPDGPGHPRGYAFDRSAGAGSAPFGEAAVLTTSPSSGPAAGPAPAFVTPYPEAVAGGGERPREAPPREGARAIEGARGPAAGRAAPLDRSREASFADRRPASSEAAAPTEAPVGEPGAAGEAGAPEPDPPPALPLDLTIDGLSQQGSRARLARSVADVASQVWSRADPGRGGAGDGTPLAEGPDRDHAPSPTDDPPLAQAHLGRAHAELVLGDGADRIHLTIAVDHLGVHVHASAASGEQAVALLGAQDDLRRALERHGLSLSEFQADGEADDERDGGRGRRRGGPGPSSPPGRGRRFVRVVI